MNKYTRVKQIGEGAFGKAVLVKRKDTSKQCVIKEVNILKMNQKEKDEARKEMAVLAQLKHPNIVSYIESFEEKGSLYIVMNFCSGGDLYGKINDQRGRLFSEDQILDWFVQLCLAVKHIHDRKILHRDIKAQNIFLTQNGTVQLGDFGIAKVLNNTMQLAHTCIGTPYYLSPEIVENMPYNNKSDVWSMGCVLYELTTLKHAFEAANMKNLVLKIIRGSYPPPPPQFSYDLRGLISQLFKRMPRDRPSVNNILKKNFIMQRVRKLLSAQDLADEFSHTVMHGHKIHKALPPAPKPSADPAKKVNPTPRPSSANKRYDPASIYGAPVAKNRSSGEQKKRPSTPQRQAAPVPGQMDWDRKQKERKEAELRRRAEMRKREQELNERRHRDLIEKQKMQRINKAREEAWRNVISPSPSEDYEVRASAEPRPLPVPKAGDRERGNYDKYNEYIDKLHRDRNTPSPAPQPAPRNLNHVDVVNVVAPRPLPAGPQHRPPAAAAVPQHRNPPPFMGPMGVPVGVPAALDQAGRDRYSYNMQKGAQAAERARVVEDYMSRQREAALNKMRHQRDIYGGRPGSGQRTPVPGPNRGAKPAPGPGRRDDRGGGGGGGGMLGGRNNEEQNSKNAYALCEEYLEKLRQIRLQNAKDRRVIRGVSPANSPSPDPAKDAEDRKRKVDALKAQAENWADLKKQDLERQRKDLMRRVAAGKSPTPGSPSPAVPITGALYAIGAGKKAQQQPMLDDGSNQPPVQLTNAMAAVRASVPSAAVPSPEPERPKTAEQKKKDSILSKLNRKGPSRGKWGKEPSASPVLAVEAEEGRGRWRSPVPGTGHLAVQEEDEGSETSRSQWGEGRSLHLSNVPLEATASQMEATSSGDKVIRVAPAESETTKDDGKSRGRWGRNSGVVHALDKLPVCQDTVTLSTTGSSDSTSPMPPVGIGATITVSHNQKPAPSSTITLSSVGQTTSPRKSPRPLPLPVERSGTIVISKDMPVPGQNSYVIPTVMSPEVKEEELPHSLHFRDVPTSVKSPTTPGLGDSLNQTQAAVGEEELPSSIRYFGNEPVNAGKGDGAITDGARGDCARGDGGRGDGAKKLETLLEVSESQSLSDADQLSVQKQFKDYMLQMKSFEDSNAIIDESAENEKKSSTLSKSTSLKLKSNISEEERDGAKSVQMHLTTGQFDMKNVSLLRTCSEPDLANLFKTMAAEADNQNDLGKGHASPSTPSTMRRHHSLDLSAVDEGNSLEENDEDEFAEEDLVLPDGEEDEGDEEKDDDEDLRSMMETMQSLMDEENEEESDEDNEKAKTMQSTTKTAGSTQKTNSKTIKQVILNESSSMELEEKDDDSDVVTSPTADTGDDEEGGEGDDEFDDDDNEEKEKLDLAASLILGNDDSDNETIFGDNDENEDEDYDRFGRLEECRVELETQLGIEKLMEVYQAIQIQWTLQEDDDASVEKGAKIALDMLGADKEHLFPKIFQLVMSDTAFTDEN